MNIELPPLPPPPYSDEALNAQARRLALKWAEDYARAAVMEDRRHWAIILYQSAENGLDLSLSDIGDMLLGLFEPEK